MSDVLFSVICFAIGVGVGILLVITFGLKERP